MLLIINIHSIYVLHINSSGNWFLKENSLVIVVVGNSGVCVVVERYSVVVSSESAIM